MRLEVHEEFQPGAEPFGAGGDDGERALRRLGPPELTGIASQSAYLLTERLLEALDLPAGGDGERVQPQGACGVSVCHPEVVAVGPHGGGRRDAVRGAEGVETAAPPAESPRRILPWARRG